MPPVEELMAADVVSVGTLTDRETAARLLAKYDLLALPVLDGEERMVGIVTVDDAIDVLTEETTEDLSIMAAVTPDEKPYFAASAWEHARHRVLWLLILMLSATITGSIITRYEDAISAVPLLVAFLPMLMDTGGNCGSQSATLVIRGLALEEIRPRDVGRVVRKELAVALIVSAVLAAANGLRIYLQYHDSRHRPGDLPVPGGHGDPGQAGGLCAAHCRQAAPHGPGHHGLSPHHHHCGCRGGADLLPGRRRAPALCPFKGFRHGTGAQKQAPAGTPAGARLAIFDCSPQEDPLPTPVGLARRRSAGRWARSPCSSGIQRVRVRRVHGHQQAAGGLGIIEQVLSAQLRLTGIHARLGKGAVAVHPRRQQTHVGQLQRLRDQVDGVHLQLQLHIAALGHLTAVAQQAKARHVGAGVDAVLHHGVPGGLVQGGHQPLGQSHAPRRTASPPSGRW